MPVKQTIEPALTSQLVVDAKKGHKKLWLTLLFIVLAGAALYGLWWWQQRSIKALQARVDQLTQQNQQLQQNANTAQPTLPAVTATTKFVNQQGQYSLSYPSDWLSLVCQGNEETVYLSPDKNSQAICASEQTSPVIFTSIKGDKRSLSPATIDQYASQVKVSATTLNGVAGKKATYTLDGNEFATAGTKVTQYEFFTNGRTYTASYSRLPGTTDLSAKFEAMVKTFKFSAS